MKKWLLYYWDCERMQYVPCFSGSWVACVNEKYWFKLWYWMRSYIIVPSW